MELQELTTTLKELSTQVEKLVQDKCTKWTDAHDNLLKVWRKQSTINLWLQLASSYYYARLNDYFSYPSIIISAATSISVFGNDNSLGGKFAIAILALLSGILTAINKHCRAAERGQEFALRAKDYYTFIRDIDFILATHKDERSDMGETLERVKSTYDRIIDMQLEPPIHIIREYEKKFKPLEASFLTDLQSEMRSNKSDTSQRMTPPIRIVPSTSQNRALFEPVIDEQKFFKNAQKKLKSTLMSPYQLYSGSTVRVDGPTTGLGPSHVGPSMQQQASLQRTLSSLMEENVVSESNKSTMQCTT